MHAADAKAMPSPPETRRSLDESASELCKAEEDGPPQQGSSMALRVPKRKNRRQECGICGNGKRDGVEVKACADCIATMKCGVCQKGKQDGVKLHVCSGCFAIVAVYSGQDCQRLDWPKHKLECTSRRSKHAK